MIAGSRGSTAAAVPGRADSGDIEIDLVELLSDVGGLAADAGRGVAVFIDEMQDLEPDDVSALCAAVHEISQTGLPFVVVGAGLPHLPAVLSASKSYSERLFRYSRIDRLDSRRPPTGRCGRRPRTRAPTSPRRRWRRLYAATAGYPYFVQAYGKVVWDVAPRTPITADDVRVAAPGGGGGAGGRLLRVAVRAGDSGRAGVPAGDGRSRPPRFPPTRPIPRDDAGADGRHRATARSQAAVAVAGPRRADQEGPGLQRRARHDRLHGAAFRPLPAPARFGLIGRVDRSTGVD